MTLSNQENDPVESSNSNMFVSALHSGPRLQLAGVTQGVATLDCAHSHHSAQSAWGLHVETVSFRLDASFTPPFTLSSCSDVNSATVQ